jgi:filamentous hemagglutinin
VGGAAVTVDNSNAPITTEVLAGQQGKHIVGSPNYNPARGTLTADPKVLLENFSGRGIQVGRTPVGKPGSKELFDAGNKTIGTWRNEEGLSAPTSRGIIYYAKRGAHIVPAAPRN